VIPIRYHIAILFTDHNKCSFAVVRLEGKKITNFVRSAGHHDDALRGVSPQLFRHGSKRIRDVQMRISETILDKLNNIEPDELVFFA